MSSPPKPAGFTSSDIESILSPMLNEILQSHQHLVVDTRSQANPSGEERPTASTSRPKTGFDALLATLKPQTRNKGNATPPASRKTMMMTKKMVMDPVPEDEPELVVAEESPGNNGEKNLPTSLSQLVGLTMDKIRRESNEANRRHSTQAPNEWLFTGDPSNVAAVLEPHTANLIGGTGRENARLNTPNEQGGNRGPSLDPDGKQMMPQDQQPRPPSQNEGGLFAKLGQQQPNPQFNAKIAGTTNNNGVSKFQNTAWEQQHKQSLNGDQMNQLALQFPGSHRNKQTSLLADSLLQKGAPVPSTLELQKLLLQHHKNQMLLKKQQQQQQQQQIQNQQHLLTLNHQQVGSPPVQSRRHSNSAELSFGHPSNQISSGQFHSHPNNKGLVKNASAAGRGNNILSFSTSASIGVSSGQRRIGEAAEDTQGKAAISQSQVGEENVDDWIPTHGYHPTVDIQETQKETMSQLQAHSSGDLGAIHAKETFGTHQLVTLGELCYLMSPSQELRLLGTKAECDLNDNKSQRLNHQNRADGETHAPQLSSNSERSSSTSRKPQVGSNAVDSSMYPNNRTQEPIRPQKASRPKHRPPPSRRRNKLSPKENAIWRTLKSLPVFKTLVQTIAASGNQPS